MSIERKWKCFEIISDRVTLGNWNGERWGWGVFDIANDHRQGKVRSQRYESLKDLLWWRMFFGIDWGHGNLISWVFKLGFLRRLRMMVRNLDSSQIKISIFVLLIRCNHFNMPSTNYSSQNKMHSQLLQAMPVGGKSVLNKCFLAI
jgi:hypothetical protein